MKKAVGLCLVSCLMASSLAACSQTSEVAEDSIVVGVFDMPTLYLMETFDDMGYFEANGANIEFEYFSVYSDAITAFNTQNVDMICYAISEAVTPVVSGIDVSVIGVFDTSYGLDGIAALEGIDSVEDLAGKTVATEIGTVDHMLLIRALESVGLTTDDIELVNMGAGDAAAAMQGGSLDAVATWEPQLSTAAEAGSIIFSTVEDPDLIVDAFVIHNDVLEAQYDNAKAIVQTWYECIELYEEDSSLFVTEAAAKGNLTEDEFYELMDTIDLLSIEDNVTKFTTGTDDIKYLNVLLPEVGEFLYDCELIEVELTNDMIDSMLDASIINELAE